MSDSDETYTDKNKEIAAELFTHLLEKNDDRSFEDQLKVYNHCTDCVEHIDSLLVRPSMDEKCAALRIWTHFLQKHGGETIFAKLTFYIACVEKVRFPNGTPTWAGKNRGSWSI